ncbi:hypothetical protein P4O66_009464, partial [Electrophorus voltai]
LNNKKMLACTEMITMCLQSAKREHLRSKQEQQLLQNHGLSIFHDVSSLYILDKHKNDGKLSFEEFRAYFSDGILTADELQELFCSIDGRQANNLDIDKLSDYFSQHLGEYLHVLSALENLNISILKAMDKTKEEYQGSSVLGQFVTRFMLRETSSQLLSLQMSLQCAMEAVEEQSSPTAAEVKVPEHLSVQKNNRKCGRRMQKNMCLSPTDPYSGILTTGVTVDADDHWSSQINRLQQLIDKLECQSPKLEPLKEDPLASTYKSNILLVQRQMRVTEDNLEEFQKALKSYADSTTNQSDNLHVSIQKLPEKSCYIIYEFWQDRISWMSYLQSEASKTFQRCIIDTLEDPELVSTMLMPGRCWAAGEGSVCVCYECVKSLCELAGEL